MMKIVVVFDNNKYPIEILPSYSVGQLKTIAVEHIKAKGNLRLVQKGTTLDDYKLLSAYDIKNVSGLN